MKTLVIGRRGTWLAEHLGCTLLTPGETEAGDGLVTKVAACSPDVWDCIVVSDGSLDLDHANVVGWSKLGEKLQKDRDYQATLLLGCGLHLATGDVEGVGCGLVGWWTGDDWTGSAVVVGIQQELMNRDLGPRCPFPQGVVVQGVERDGFGLFDETLGLVASGGLLKGYKGPVCIELVIGDGQVVVKDLMLGFRAGWLEPVLELQRGSLLAKPLELLPSIATGVAVSVPPWPYGDGEAVGFSLSGEARKHCRVHDCWKSPEGLSGKGLLFYATAWGSPEVDSRESRMRVYRSLRRMRIPEVQYRTDVGTLFSGVMEAVLAI